MITHDREIRADNELADEAGTKSSVKARRESRCDSGSRFDAMMKKPGWDSQRQANPTSENAVDNHVHQEARTLFKFHLQTPVDAGPDDSVSILVRAT
jgi:hypothetical protein